MQHTTASPQSSILLFLCLSFHQQTPSVRPHTIVLLSLQHLTLPQLLHIKNLQPPTLFNIRWPLPVIPQLHIIMFLCFPPQYTMLFSLPFFFVVLQYFYAFLLQYIAPVLYFLFTVPSCSYTHVSVLSNIPHHNTCRFRHSQVFNMPATPRNTLKVLHSFSSAHDSTHYHSSHKSRVPTHHVQVLTHSPIFTFLQYISFQQQLLNSLKFLSKKTNKQKIIKNHSSLSISHVPT